MTRTLVTSLFLTLGLLTSGASLTPAHAEDPIDVTRQITDKAGALGRQQPEVRRALDRFFDRTGLQLFVVYVPTFGELTGAEWAAQTKERSELGRGDVLLVVATKDDELVREGVERLLRDGGGAGRQRAAGGDDTDLDAVARDLLERTRASFS